MAARSWTLLSICLVLAQAFMGVAMAKEVGTKIGNHTIERVRFATFFRGQGVRDWHGCLQTVQLRTHSIFPPYIDQDLQNRFVLLNYEFIPLYWRPSLRWWDFGADAYIVSRPERKAIRHHWWGIQNTNKHIRLTQNKPSQMVCFRGLWLIAVPLTFIVGLAVVTTGTHRLQLCHRDWVQGKRAPSFTQPIDSSLQVSGDSSHLYGDGFALWITTERAQPGPIFGNKGPWLYRMPIPLNLSPL